MAGRTGIFSLSLSVSLSLYIYIYLFIYVYIYIYCFFCLFFLFGFSGSGDKGLGLGGFAADGFRISLHFGRDFVATLPLLTATACSLETIYSDLFLMFR